MSKRQSLKNDGTSAKKIDPTVLAAMIGGIVTIIATLITVLVPISLKPKELTPIPPACDSVETGYKMTELVCERSGSDVTKEQTKHTNK